MIVNSLQRNWIQTNQMVISILHSNILPKPNTNERCCIYNIFTTNQMWQLVLIWNHYLKLFFCLSITTNNNLLFRICCENIVNIIFLNINQWTTFSSEKKKKKPTVDDLDLWPMVSLFREAPWLPHLLVNESSGLGFPSLITIFIKLFK